MARQPRLLLSKSYYHIMTRGTNRMSVFKEPKDYTYFLELVARFKKSLPFNLYHYCLMPNHVHLLVQTDNTSDFSDFMKNLNLAYYAHFNKKYRWVGHLWQNRYKSQPVGKDEYFLQCGKYIELNPVRAKLAQNPSNYPYSSYRFYTRGDQNPLITEDPIYQELSDDTERRKKIYHELVISDIVLDHYKHRIWGSNDQRYNEDRKSKRKAKLLKEEKLNVK